MGHEEEGTSHRWSCQGKDLNEPTNDRIGLDSVTPDLKVSLATFGLDGFINTTTNTFPLSLFEAEPYSARA